MGVCIREGRVVCFQEQEDLFTVIAAVLHLGNVLFVLDESDAAMVTDPNGAVKMASVSVSFDFPLLSGIFVDSWLIGGSSEKSQSGLLCTRVIQVSGNQEQLMSREIQDEKTKTDSSDCKRFLLFPYWSKSEGSERAISEHFLVNLFLSCCLHVTETKE